LAIVLALFVLSATLMATTVLPSTPLIPLLEILSAAAAVGFLATAPRLFRASSRAPTFDGDRFDWRTPRLTLLSTPAQSTGRRVLFGLIGAYLAVSSVLLVVRVVRLAIG